MSPGATRGLRALGVGLAIAVLVAARGIVFHIVSTRLALGGAAAIAFAVFAVAAHLGLMGGVFRGCMAARRRTSPAGFC